MLGKAGNQGGELDQRVVADPRSRRVSGATVSTKLEAEDTFLTEGQRVEAPAAELNGDPAPFVDDVVAAD